MDKLGVFAGSLAVVLAAAACGGDGVPTAVESTTTANADTDVTTSVAPDTDSATTGGDATTPTTPVPEFLDFTAADVRGGEVDASIHTGSDLVLWFWAPW